MAIPDYSLGMVPPSQVSDQFSQGLQDGIGLRQAADTRAASARLIATQDAASKLAAQKAAEEAAARAQQQADFIEAAKSPTAQKTAALIVKYPSMADGLTKAYTALNDQEKQSYQSLAQRAHAAQLSGHPETAAKILREAAVGYENSGMPDRAKALEDTAKNVEANKDVATLTLGGFLASTMGPENYSKTYETSSTIAATSDEAKAKASKAATDARFANDKALADLGYTKAQTNRLYAQTKNDADRLALDREKMVADQLARASELEATVGKLPDAVRKDADAAIRDGVAAKLQAQSAEDLAKKFRDYDRTGNLSSSGARAWFQEGVKAFTGFEDDVSAMRKQHKALTATLVTANLPPGAASDTDIALVKGGIPSENAAPSAIAGFLEASARVQRAVEKQKRVESEYLYKNQGLGPARGDMLINGVPVRAGETFEQASERATVAAKTTAPEARAAAANAITDGFNQ